MADIDNDTSYPLQTTLAGTDQFVIIDKTSGVVEKVTWTNVISNFSDASATVKGKVELATDAETVTGTDATRAVTPAGLQSKTASETASGIIELATSAEVLTGTDTSRAVTPAGAAAAYAPLNGWNLVSGAWAYASASTITVPSGAASLYNKGDKVRLKQGAGYKYYYIITVADALLTVTGGTDYTVANAAITDVYYSKAENPLDFPTWFNYTPTFGGFTASVPTITTCQFRCVGKSCHVSLVIGNAGTSNATTHTVTAPITAAAGAYGWVGRVYDNGSQTTQGYCDIAAASGTINMRKSAGAAWTNANGKSADFGIIYQI